MKRGFLIGLSLICLLALISCGKKDVSSAGASASSQASSASRQDVEYPWDGTYGMERDGVTYSLDMAQLDDSSLDFHIKAVKGGATAAQLLESAQVDGNAALFEGEIQLRFTLQEDGGVKVEQTGEVTSGSDRYDFSGVYRQ